MVAEFNLCFAFTSSVSFASNNPFALAKHVLHVLLTSCVCCGTLPRVLLQLLGQRRDAGRARRHTFLQGLREYPHLLGVAAQVAINALRLLRDHRAELSKRVTLDTRRGRRWR